MKGFDGRGFTFEINRSRETKVVELSFRFLQDRTSTFKAQRIGALILFSRFGLLGFHHNGS